MSVRSSAWVVHGIVVVAMLTVVGTWAFEVARADAGYLQLGRLIGLAGVSAAVLHALLTTGLVAVWGTRPRAVVGIHAFGAVIAALVFVSTCARIG